jgi:Chondroitinase B
MHHWRYVFTLCLLVSAAPAFADNVLHPSTPILDRPTLMALGVQLPVTGDDNYNATVTVRYRQSGTTTWKSALPLYRVHPETIYAYSIAPQFSGSIVDLRPNTTYDIELHAVDPDGPIDQTFTLTATTRAVPGDPVSPRTVAVTNPAQLQAALSSAQAGDVITLAAGIYPGNFGISNSGTAANPIVIRGASQDGVVLDGQNCTGCNIFEIYGSYTHLENMTLRNAERAIRFQTSGSQANVVRRAHIQNTTFGISGRSNQLDFYIADNILEGRLTWPLIYTSDGGIHSDDDGIQVTGFGMVIAHNRISGYGDAMKNGQRGARALDVYGNDVLWTYDNAIELDETEGNSRAIRNRFTNTNAALSFQPVYAGPAYVLRNIISNTVDEQMKFHALNIATPPPQPNGVFAYHNTFLSSGPELQVQTPFASHHFALENNLFIGPNPLPGYAINWDAPIDDGTFDYNGYYPDNHFLFRWAAGYANYSNFAQMQSAGVERHGALLSPATFANGLTAPTDYTMLMAPPDVSLSASTPALNRGLVLPNINDGFAGAAPDLGALESGCPAPIFGPRPVGVDESNEPLGCSGDAQQLPAPTGTAAFVRTDTTTQGSWKSSYGREGAIVIGDSTANPPFVNVTPGSNSTYLWTASTSDVRALQKLSTPDDRVAGCWFSFSTFTIDLNFSDGQAHQVAFYATDFDGSNSRAERVDILDANGTVLDSQSLAAFSGGQYLVWNLSGHVIARITNINPSPNAVIGGIFFGGGAATGSAAFLRTDTTTQGSWKSAYGKDGAAILGDSISYPSYVTVTPAGHAAWTWAASTSDGRALAKRASPTDRIASCWYSSSAFTLDLNFTDGQTHQVALYALDWDADGRTQTFDVLDASGNLLDTRSIANFIGGQYLVWNLSGHVVIRMTNGLPSSNAVISGIFFGAGGAQSPVAFVRADTTTQGSWQSLYGKDGAAVIGDSSGYPSYVTVTPASNLSYVWAASTSDVRGLQKRSSATDRIAACWYSFSSFNINLDFTDGQAHQVALYAIDWDLGGRTQTVEILDPGGAVLDTRSISNYTGGVYLVWNLSGHVIVRLTNTHPPSNAVVSGLFFDPPV